MKLKLIRLKRARMMGFGNVLNVGDNIKHIYVNIYNAKAGG
jgi:hypothetical protein